MEEKEKTRKPYQKPLINQVKMVVEEAVLLACKTSSNDPARGNKVCGHPKCRSTIGS